jgi:hypothetical protein
VKPALNINIEEPNGTRQKTTANPKLENKIEEKKREKP